MRDANVPVNVVVMTDGRRSHRHLIEEDVLARMRADEVVRACARLGIDAGRLTLMGYPDGALHLRQVAAVPRVMAMLDEHRPTDVFVPYRDDGPSDHLATTAIVLAAIARAGQRVQVYEYPVWFMHQWPFVKLGATGASNRITAIAGTVSANFRLFRDFNVVCDVSSTLIAKREALDEHRSQMCRLATDTRWAVLSDVADGAFLACFRRPFEVFCAR